MAQLSDFQMDMTGKKVLITGAARGIGKEMVLALARAGADVAIVDILEEQLTAVVGEIKALGRNAIPIQGDISNQKEVDLAVDKAIKELGAIDVLICNAGVSWHKRAEDITEDEWLKVMNININGTFYMCQSVGKKQMIPNIKGKIIITCSVVGLRGGPGIYLHYSTSKGAVVAMTRALAMEWGRHHINVNGIAPGTIKTEMNASRYADPEAAKKYLKMIPLGFVPGPEILGPLTIYMASEASDYMTGEIVVIDGGMSQHW